MKPIKYFILNTRITVEGRNMGRFLGSFLETVAKKQQRQTCLCGKDPSSFSMTLRESLVWNIKTMYLDTYLHMEILLINWLNPCAGIHITHTKKKLSLMEINRKSYRNNSWLDVVLRPRAFTLHLVVSIRKVQPFQQLSLPWRMMLVWFWINNILKNFELTNWFKKETEREEEKKLWNIWKESNAAKVSDCGSP